MGFSFVVTTVRSDQAWDRYITHWLKGFFLKNIIQIMRISRKKDHQRCLVNAFVRLVVIMNTAYIKCISSLLSKHNN